MNRMVRLVIALVALMSVAAVAGAQAGTPPTAVPIRDNSFLIEEAYNQEFGVVQHISTFHRVRRAPGWEATFTQEWPAPNERHQLSYTVPVIRSPAVDGNHTGIGDVLLNYRFQVPMAPGSRTAASPRLSLVLPTGHDEWGQGSGALGVDVNLPLSIEFSPWLVSHSNLGGGWTPSARNELGEEATARGVFIGQSLIWLAHPKFNVMLEALWSRDESVVANDRTAWTRSFLVSPGVRAAFDLPSGLQIVPGIAVPIGVGPSDGERGVFVYLSFEHPFRKQ
jgi:hypothetical protein